MKKSVYLPVVCAVAILSAVSCQDHLNPQPGPACQIIQEVVKTGTPGSAFLVGDTVIIDQATFGVPRTQTYRLDVTQTRKYQYNSMGQLKAETIDNLNLTPGRAVNDYQYTPSTLRISGLTPSGFVTELGYYLNAQGLITSNVQQNTTYSYDTNGYLTEVTEALSAGGTVKTTNTISNGNLVKKEVAGPTYRLVTVYVYDLTKAGLPNKRIFEGQQSRNLLLKSVQDFADNTNGVILRTNFTKTYRYFFGDQDRVSRALEVTTYSSAGGGGQPVLTDLVLVTTTDYTYSCK